MFVPSRLRGSEIDRTRAGADVMEIKRSGTQASQKGPSEHFTGTVRIDPLFQSSPPARAAGAYVTFEPCSRSDWHTNPLGQTLIVTAGCGLHQRWGGPIEEIRPGDVVTVGPNEKHWHGAAPTDVFDFALTQEDMDRIATLDTKASSFLDHRDPKTVKSLSNVRFET
jgi:quercetin dioxygenase-like cupin family protein